MKIELNENATIAIAIFSICAFLAIMVVAMAGIDTP